MLVNDFKRNIYGSKMLINDGSVGALHTHFPTAKV